MILNMKKLLSFGLMICTVFSVLTATALPVSANESTFSHLTSVPEGYIGIYTKADLRNIKNDSIGSYILMNDIIFDESDFAKGGEYYNKGLGWQPLAADYDHPFAGVFDGNGYVIENLYIHYPESTRSSAVGLFLYSSGEVKNLGLVNAYMEILESNTIFGAIVAYNTGNIDNCYTSGFLYGSDFCAGIAGINKGNITRCYNTAFLGGNGNIGGIAAYNVANGINKCYNSGSILADITERAYIGGIAGINYAEIKNAFNVGTISVSCLYISYTDAKVGGIAGSSTSNSVGEEKSTPIIRYCYNAGDINIFVTTEDQYYVGEVVGKNDSESSVSDCHYISGRRKGIGGAGVGTGTFRALPLSRMKIQSAFAAFNFETVWKMGDSERYPFPVLREVPFEFQGKYGDINNDFLVSAADALLILQKSVNKIEFDETQTALADFDDDGKITANDALTVLQVVVDKLFIL